MYVFRGGAKPSLTVCYKWPIPCHVSDWTKYYYSLFLLKNKSSGKYWSVVACQQTHAAIVMSPRPTITCRVSTYLLFFSDRCHSVTMHSTLIKHSPLVVLPPARPLTELDEQEALHRSLLWCRLCCDTQMRGKTKQMDVNRYFFLVFLVLIF